MEFSLFLNFLVKLCTANKYVYAFTALCNLGANAGANVQAQDFRRVTEGLSEEHVI